jgi:hypothetical protein
MFATENKRHIRYSSTILQDVVPTHWKCFTIYTPRIQGRVQFCSVNHVTCVLVTTAHHILFWHELYTTPCNSCRLYVLNTTVFFPFVYTAVLQILLNT